MDDHGKTKEQLINELVGARSRIAELEAAETEHREAEEALRTSEERYRTLAESSPDCIKLVNREGRVVMCNAVALKLSGLSKKEDLIGKEIAPFFPEEYQPAVEEAIEKALQGETVRIQTCVPASKGALSWWDDAFVPVMSKEGRVANVLFVGRDITQLVEAEKGLQIKTVQLAAVVNSMTTFLETGDFKKASALLISDALKQTDSEYGFIGVVAEGGTLRILAHEGIVWDAVAGREFYNEAVRTYQEVGYLEFTNFENLFGEVITGGETVVSNDPGGDPRSGGLPPGHPPLQSFLGVPILSGTEVVGLVGVANRPEGYTGAEQANIEILSQAASVLYDSYRRQEREAVLEAEQKQAEEEFRSLKELHENVVQSIQDGLVAIDLEFRITYWNKAMEKITGYKAEEVLGKVATDLFPYLREQEVDKFFRAAMEGQVVELTNALYETPKGKAVYMNKKFFPLRDQAGEIIGALAIVEDLTELRHLEEQLANLQDEIEQRKLVEIAKGILMRVMDVPEPKSYLILQKKSQDENLKMVEVAKQVIEVFGSPKERKKFS